MGVPGEQFERIANFHGWLIQTRLELQKYMIVDTYNSNDWLVWFMVFNATFNNI
jgi:hypothetical protein